MSIETLSAVLNMNVGDSTRKLVLIGLANHAHKDGTAAWTGVKLLAEYANCSRRTVQRHLATLLETGFIREGDQSVIPSKIPLRERSIAYEVAMDSETIEQWKAEYRPGLRGVAATYGRVGGERSAQVRRGDNVTPLHDRGLDAKDAQVVGGDNLSPLPEDASGVTPVTAGGDTGDRLGVTPVSPKPSLQPSQEPTTSSSTPDGADPLPIEASSSTEAKDANDREDVTRVCEHLRNRMIENGCKPPTITKQWRDEARRLMDLDGRTEDQVHNAIEWATRDEFWRANVLSMATLRKQYDKLRLAAQRGGPRQGYTDEKNYGTQQDRDAELEARKNMTPEQIQTEVDAALRPRGQQAG